MCDQTLTNWRVPFWTGSRESRSVMTVKSSDSSATNITESPAFTSASALSQMNRCLNHAIDNVVFRPLIWVLGGRT